MGELTAGIDIGTTSVKAVAVDGDGVVVARARIPHEVHAPDHGTFEHNAQAAWVDGVLHAWDEIAKGNDIWMHVHGFAGSHVVIRLLRGKTASLDDLTSAAALAVHYSKRRGHGRCEVSYTPRKYVRKGRRMAPGAVTLDRFKVLTLQDIQAHLSQAYVPTAGQPEPSPACLAINGYPMGGSTIV